MKIENHKPKNPAAKKVAQTPPGVPVPLIIPDLVTVDEKAANPSYRNRECQSHPHEILILPEAVDEPLGLAQNLQPQALRSPEKDALKPACLALQNEPILIGLLSPFPPAAN